MSEMRTCQNCKSEFGIEPEDFEFYEKVDVSAPTHCSPCRYQRRLANRNEWTFYHRDCGLCSKTVVSIYNPDYPGPVYCQQCWWSDDWDTLSFGREIDFSRPFFEQFKELRFSVPRVALANSNSVNSEYTNQTDSNKNCYMITASSSCEDCLYGTWNQKSKGCVDCHAVESCELLYECLSCSNCYKSSYLRNCISCSESSFLFDCRGCSHCFGCVGLRNASYCWFNEQLTKEEYTRRLSEFTWDKKNIEEALERWDKLRLSLRHKYFQGSGNVYSTGNYIENNKDSLFAFNVRHGEKLKYGQDAWSVKDSMDVTETLSEELDYETEGVGWSSRNVVLAKGWHTSQSYYSEYTFNSTDLFGCVSIRKKSYCILNKQYSKEEYHELKEKLISHMKETGEWGEFFPADISPFSYNDTVAQLYFPMTRESVLEKGWSWHERAERAYQPTRSFTEVASEISSIDDGILNEVIGCRSQSSEEEKEKYLSCVTAFRVTKQELLFYREMGLPLPDRCFPCRRQGRLNLRNPRKLWHRQCMCELGEHEHSGRCSNEFETSYAPEREEKVFCEGCYNQEVV